MEDLGFERARYAIHRSIKLVKAGRREKALELLDRYLEQATQENRNDVILLLSCHAEVLATAGGELQRVKRYAGQRLGRVADYSFQLYNYARLLLRLGEVEEARSRAAEAYELTRTQKTREDQDLARAILEQWPDLGESPNLNQP